MNAAIAEVAASLDSMVAEARPRNEGDWGSDRQIDAENRLFDLLSQAWPDDFGEDSEFAMWGLKATTDELIDRAVEIAKEKLASASAK